MKRKLRLKKGVKIAIGYMFICIITVFFVNVCIDRVEDINNGSVRVISESEMAERN